jgi:hypothetical protein
VAIETAPDVEAEVVLHGVETRETVVNGVAVDLDGRLLLTMLAGVALVDLGMGSVDWAVPIPGCRRNALPRADGSVLVVCGETVVRWDKNELQIVAGGFTGGMSLPRGPDDEVWVFDYKGAGWLEAGLPVDISLTEAPPNPRNANPLTGKHGGRKNVITGALGPDRHRLLAE